MPDSPARQPPPRSVIEQAGPAVAGGRHAAKRCVGDAVTVTAQVFRDGHDLVRAVAAARPTGEDAWREAPMAWIDRHIDGDTWAGEVVVDAAGDWELTVIAWTDVWGTWRDELDRKVEAGQTDLGGELSEGALVVADAARRAGDERLERAAAALGDAVLSVEERAGVALDPGLHAAMEQSADRHGETRLATPLPLWVDRPLARFGSWYELFPRSWGGFRGVAEQMPRLAQLGFDVVYLPPVHPIGSTNRKGPNNALVAGPDDPGSPWAIGSAEGGHTALHPELGSFDDFMAMIEAGQSAGVE